VTTVSEGTLRVTGTLATPGDTVTVVSGATLSGSGTIQRTVSVASSGTLAPGQDTLTVKNVTMVSGATLAFTSAGATCGQLIIPAGGTVDVTDATLVISGDSTASSLTIVDNQSGNAVNGQFANAPDGGLVTVGSKSYRITYTGGTGNDVVLMPGAAGAIFFVR
jgi:hypothetical protein